MKRSLKSSIEQKGKIVTEVITCVTGFRKTFRGVKADSIEVGKFTHFETEDGRLVMVNDDNVIFVEVFEEER